jgi:hypothetical protein
MANEIGDAGMAIIRETYSQIPHYLRTVVTEGAYVTYAALLEDAWGEDHYYQGGIALLARARARSEAQIKRHLAELERVGAIEIQRRGRRLNNRILIMPWSAICAEVDGSSLGFHLHDGGA